MLYCNNVFIIKNTGDVMNFEYQKAVQAINFFARKSRGLHISKLHVLKLIYLADRYHLRKYGRLITNDNYLAMTYGPVASSVKDLAEQSEFLSDQEEKYARAYLHKADPSSHSIKSIKDIDLDVFSQTDLEALNTVWDKFHQMPQYEIVKFTHGFPEWKKHESKLGSLNTRVNMNPADFFDKAPDKMEYCNTPDELIALNKELFEDTIKFDDVWG
jgi:uncharacterized phage-associated protein